MTVCESRLHCFGDYIEWIWINGTEERGRGTGGTPCFSLSCSCSLDVHYGVGEGAYIILTGEKAFRDVESPHTTTEV